MIPEPIREKHDIQRRLAVEAGFDVSTQVCQSRERVRAVAAKYGMMLRYDVPARDIAAPVAGVAEDRVPYGDGDG